MELSPVKKDVLHPSCVKQTEATSTTTLNISQCLSHLQTRASSAGGKNICKSAPLSLNINL